jgi:hypothetical protein
MVAHARTPNELAPPSRHRRVLTRTPISHCRRVLTRTPISHSHRRRVLCLRSPAVERLEGLLAAANLVIAAKASEVEVSAKQLHGLRQHMGQMQSKVVDARQKAADTHNESATSLQQVRSHAHMPCSCDVYVVAYSAAASPRPQHRGRPRTPLRPCAHVRTWPTPLLTHHVARLE